MAKTLGLGTDSNYYWIDLTKQDLQECIVEVTTKLSPNQLWNVANNVDLTSARLNSLVVIGENDESTYKYTSDGSSTVVIGFLINADDGLKKVVYIENQNGMILRPGSAEELARTKPLGIDEDDYRHVEHFNLPGGEEYEAYLQAQATTISSSEQTNNYDNDDILDLETGTTATESTSKKRPRENGSTQVADKLQAMLRQRAQEKEEEEKIKVKKGRPPKKHT